MLEKDQYKSMYEHQHNESWEYYEDLKNLTEKYNTLVLNYNNQTDEYFATRIELNRLRHNYSTDLIIAENKLIIKYNKKYQDKVREYNIKYESQVKNVTEKIRTRYEENCESYNICTIKRKDIDFGLGGVYFGGQDYYCVNMRNADIYEQKRRDCHEACHNFVEERHSHFCELDD